MLKHRSQDDFRIKLVEALLAIGKDAQVPRKRGYLHINAKALEVLVHCHQHVKMLIRKDYAACKGVRHYNRPLKRVVLAEIAANSGRPSARRTSWYGYKQCGVSLCKEGGCFERYYSNL